MGKLIKMSAFRARRARAQGTQTHPPDDSAGDRIELDHLAHGAYRVAIGGLYADDPDLAIRSLGDVILQLASRLPESRPYAVEVLADIIQQLAIAARSARMASGPT
ncbi:hypothetical protein [Cupriavidus basilensis]